MSTTRPVIAGGRDMPVPSHPPVRIGIVGAGKNTRERHIPGFRALPGVEVVCVANRTRESSQQAARELGIPKAHDRWQDVVADPGVDAVCIGTWPYVHREISNAALEHGKHVLCEARMAMNAEEGRDMLRVARAHPDLVAQLVPSPFTLPADAAVAKLVAEGYVGEVISVDIRGMQPTFADRQAPLHWRQDPRVSGPNILSMGIWYEAMLRWVGPSTSVMAMLQTIVPERVDADGVRRPTLPDHVDLLMRLARGGIAHLRVSAVTGLAATNEVWIFGTEGTIHFDSAKLRIRGGRRDEKELADIPFEKGAGWRVEEEFVNAIRGKEPVTRTTFEDGVRYMEFTDAVTTSAASGAAAPIADL